MDDIDLIKQKINVVDLISEYLPLKKAGVNYKAPCPFHDEKTPSFMVSPERGIFHCFGCGKGGDIFEFLMEKEGWEFPEALEYLAKKAGVILKRKKSDHSDQKLRLYQINEKAAQFFHYLLVSHQLGKPALQYLYNRGLTDETIKQFNLGYAPNSWESLTSFLKKKGFKKEDLVLSGLTVDSPRGGYDRFRGRIIFPIVDTKDQVRGFSGRVLEVGEPKYLNTPQTLVFNKGELLFGLNLSKNFIRQKGFLVLTEGEMDMILSFQSGVKNTVASKGTALTIDQIELIKKYTDTIVLSFDMDTAGDSASRRGIEMAENAGLTIKVIGLPEGKDPAELILKDPHSWQNAVNEAQSIYDYYLGSVQKRFNLKTAEGKKSAASELIPIWGKIADPITFEHYLQKLAALLGMDEGILRTQVTKPPPASYPNYTQILKITDKKSDLASRQDALQEYLISLLLKIPADITYVPSFPETLFLSERLRSLYVFLVIYLDKISFKGASFAIDDFIKELPDEIISLVDRLYLVEVDGKLSNSKLWLEEVHFVTSSLKKILVKASLEKLSAQIKSAQSFGQIEQLEVLNKRFRDLSLKLRNL